MAEPRGRLRRALVPEGLRAGLLAGPAVLGLVLFLVLPFVFAVGASFTSYRLNSPLPLRWVGIANFREIFTDSGTRRAFGNTLLFVATVVPLQTGLALLLALLVNLPLRGRVIFRTVFFLPVIYPMALVAVVWSLIFAPGPEGLMNHLLHGISFGAWDPETDFFRDPRWAMPAIVLMSVWQGVGFQMVILLAGLQTIPASLYECAALDGAGPVGRFWHITLPQLRSTLGFVALVTAILAFRLFDQVWILTQGGPDDATTTLLYEGYVAARERNQIGLGSAITVVFFVLVAALALVNSFVLRRRRAEA